MVHQAPSQLRRQLCDADVQVRDAVCNKPTSPRDLHCLVDIRQEKGESLRTFIDRFGKVAMSIRNLSQDVAMHHMMIALRRGPFAGSLCMHPAASLDEL